MKLAIWSKAGWVRSMVLVMCCVLCASCAQENRHADLILTNAQVYTLSWGDPDIEGVPSADAPFSNGVWNPEALAIAIRGSIIVGVGSDEELEAFVGPTTEVIDLQGAAVIPGLVESHGHLHELGEKNEEINLLGVSTEAEIEERLRASAMGRPAGEWILGSGWDEGEWANELPTRGFIDRLFPDNPVVLKGMRGFGTLGNERALSAARVSDETPDPVGGELVRDEWGHLTGVFLNNATDMLNNAIPERTLEQKKRVLNYGFDRLLESGYVSTHHAGVRMDYLPAYQAMAESEELPMRVEAMLSAGPNKAPDVEYWTQRGPTTDPAEFLQLRSIKAYYDASLGSRGASMIEDYSDMPGHRGVAGADYDFDPERVTAFMAAGFQAGIHAIGDGGNRDVLDFYETVFEQHPEARELRNRIEHAQVIHPDDFSRFEDLKIVASMEPGHAVEDSPWAEERVGPERVRGAYAWRTLRRNGAGLIFNSDFTGTDWSFFYGMYAAITRQMKDGTPAGGWYPEESMTAEEALRAYTIWPAYASSREEETGSIEDGKWADLTVLSIDPLNVGSSNPSELLDGRVLMTIVAGKLAYVAN